MRELLDEAVRAMLAAATGKEVALGKTPVPAPILPYAIVYPGRGSEGYGAWSDPEGCRDFLFQVKSVGESPKQCGWMSKKIESAMVGRNGSGEFDQAIVVAGATVDWRLVELLGSILPSGEELWQVDDMYRLRVER